MGKRRSKNPQHPERVTVICIAVCQAPSEIDHLIVVNRSKQVLLEGHSSRPGLIDRIEGNKVTSKLDSVNVGVHVKHQ